MKTILELLAGGEYDHSHEILEPIKTSTRGLSTHTEIVDIPRNETIHGNPVRIVYRYLVIENTKRSIAGEYTFLAHARKTIVPADRMIEELRKHI